ncbi:MAG: 1-(5-phosphoribosyl)-5-[(5-phosphoribosylamino)methylideneamino]imidazole-4-carboxamide isomerase [Clostridia bacterium]|nr:1-(5-phosphoribosyl)-5-[(5-phosphoribosylamino)methylideneamino]imidazole-4-carboxamide isomerase [Clostridia bacterium]
MLIFPAIDIIDGCAVRLFQGDYGKKTVYGDPLSVAGRFVAEGAKQIHLVDLDGAKNGGTPNFPVIREIKRSTGLFCEVGGGIRDMETAKRYADAGIDRLILGTAAITDPDFAAEAIERFGDMIAFGIDVRDGKVAVKGWTETTETDVFEFCGRAEEMGAAAVICTDISKDGAMKGVNLGLYESLTGRFGMKFIASGGVSSLCDVWALRAAGLHGAIIGKAYYTGAVGLPEAIEAAG